MNIAGIELELRDLVKGDFDPATFIFRLIEIYDAPKATITKLRQGSANQAKAAGDVLWKAKLFFRVAAKGKTAAAIEALSGDALVRAHKPRFIMATDGVEFQCRDTKADQSLDVDLAKLNDRFDFLLPLAGIERYEAVAENPADIRATGRLAKLYDAILDANPGWAAGTHTHELNLFMTRMLFCLFAERTSIFEPSLFSKTIYMMTKEDGTDTAHVLQTLFTAMDTPPAKRKGLIDFVQKFPYVNGGLFAERKPVPAFSPRARRMLRDCGELSWQDINPDIFGSMIQAVVEPGLRGDMGMHYTSVPNIMKVLQPLFLLSLEGDLEAARDSEPKLRKLLARLYSIRVFDPACGSGNFLIIAYRELRSLENRIFVRLQEITGEKPLPLTGIRLSHFYGIELADFAAETAKLSLWIAEYQANKAFKDIFGSAPPALPLKESGNIIHGNATRLDWAKVCPAVVGGETYIVGNPPYLGRRQQNAALKEDIAHVFRHVSSNFKKLDLVACWILKAAEYSRAHGAKTAFVTTNSICQGELVPLLWPLIYERGQEISFAHQSFSWKNNAADNAGVTCVIIGLRPVSTEKKHLYSGVGVRVVQNIGPYLLESDNLIVVPVANSKASLPEMRFGNMAADGGNLILSPQERRELLDDYPQAESLLRRGCGSQEFIKGIERWCLWIADDQLALAKSIPPIAERIKATKKSRLESPDAGTRDLALRPHSFRETHMGTETTLLVPRMSSERRLYFPVGYIPTDWVVIAPTLAVYDAAPFVFSILSSRLHALWALTVCGQLETRIRYSNTLGYNTFPLPPLSEAQATTLDSLAVEIATTRERYLGKTIAWMYHPDTMPNDLLAAHRTLDREIEQSILGRNFNSDDSRLEHLFKLYAAKNPTAAGTRLTRKAA